MTNVDELAAVLNKWSLGELSSSIEQINDGWTNLTFKFQTKLDEKIYVLREYLPSTQRTIILEDIRFELNFIAFLCNQLHLPVIPMIDPPGIFLLSNGHYCALFPFIDGIKYINRSENRN
jgi:aminoglycoside phosphotransferase (APT) family kinase protein